MENWLLYALLASVSIGMFNFMSKVQSEEGRIDDMGFIFYTYLCTGLLSLGGVFILGKELVFSSEVVIYAFLITFIYTIVIKTRLVSLRFLSSSTYFINYRMLSSALLIGGGIVLFGEQISSREIVGIIVGFIVFYLLLEKKSKKESVTDVKKGFLYLVYGAVLVALIQVIAKDFVLKKLDILSLMFFEGVFGMIISMFFVKGKTARKALSVKKVEDYIFIFLAGIFSTFSILMNNLAFLGGDVSIVYKIISYSLFIPVILSIIFYKEKVGIKKIIAFVLTIISIALFI